MTSTDNLDAIAALDLDPIKIKLMHKESGEGWSLEQANAVEFEYRRFLILMKKYPEEQTAPLFDVDIFWHYHILDTMKYARDCEQVFGYFLHHFPYVGLRGEDDLEAHHRVGQRMKELYEETFGETYERVQASADNAPATAYSSSPSQSTAALLKMRGTAYSSSPSRTADALTATAYSSAPGKTAYSSAPGKTAYSSAPGKTAYSSAATAQADGFYVDRPTLNVR